MKEKYKLAILDTHPVHYRTSLYKKISENSKIDLKVYFCSDSGLKKQYDPAFGKSIKWFDEIKGFNYKFLKNYYLRKNPIPPKGLWNFKIIKELKKEKFDAIIIYGYSSFTSKLAMIYSKIISLPVIFREEIDEIKGNIIKRIIKKVFYLIYLKLPNVFLYSYKKNKKFYERFGVDTNKLFFHPCAVDNNFFQKRKKELINKKDVIKEKFGIKRNRKIILYVGKLVKRKRPFDLLKAYEKLSEKNDISLLFIGEGDQKKELEKYVKDKKIKNVFFKGFVNQKKLPKFFIIAEIFVLPSEYDPSPKQLNEAMNFALPVIVSNKIGTANDLVKHKKQGLVYNCGNINELKKYLNKLINNKDLRKKIGERFFKKNSRWNFDKDVNATINALNYIYKNEKL